MTLRLCPRVIQIKCPSISVTVLSRGLAIVFQLSLQSVLIFQTKTKMVFKKFCWKQTVHSMRPTNHSNRAKRRSSSRFRFQIFSQGLYSDTDQKI